jgi:tetratricopeptide (TPR) repeat protein
MAGLRGAIQEAPDNDYARFQLGLRYEALGSPDKAREEYLNILQRYPQVDVSKMEGRLDLLRAFIQNHMVVEEAPPPEDLSPALRRAIPGPWKKSRTPRLTIHHHNPDLAAEIARIAEPAIERLERELEIPADRQPYALFVYRDNAAFQAGTGHSIATGYCSKPMVVHLCQTAPRLLQSVLPHELAHATLYRIYPNLPSWIDEGLAVRQEWGRELYYMNVKRWLARQDTFPLRELLQTKVTSLETARREVFYGQAFTLVDFLCQEHGGHEKFRQFIEQVASGKPVPAGLESVYGFQSIEALERIWKAHMEPGVP